MSSALLSVQNLTKSYPDFILQDITLSLPGGCILGLIGQNGAGKTTLLRSVLGLANPDSGSISIPSREEIGVVFDECRFHEGLNRKEVASINRALFKSWDDVYFSELCQRFSLPEKKRIKEYSKGMKMKLSIAAALAHHPKLLLLDEPTSGLDPVVRDEILELFQEFICDEEHSILFSSHITTDLEKIADYIAFIKNGKLQFCLPKDTITDEFFILKSGADYADRLDVSLIAGQRRNEFSVQTLLHLSNGVKLPDGEYVLEPASLDDIMVLTGKELKA